MEGAWAAWLWILDEKERRRLGDEECPHCYCFYINIKFFEECVREETAI
jgi:hypothetical protein